MRELLILLLRVTTWEEGFRQRDRERILVRGRIISLLTGQGIIKIRTRRCYIKAAPLFTEGANSRSAVATAGFPVARR